MFLAGLFFVGLGLGLALISSDVYLLLLSVFGIVFMLQIWSFWQLNAFTVTTDRVIFQQAYSSIGTLVIHREHVTSLTVDQGIAQWVCRVCTLVIGTLEEDVHVKLKHPGEVRGLVDRFV